MEYTTIPIQGDILSADILDKIKLSLEWKNKSVPNFS